MWGLGGLTFGLTMRYLGMSLGMAVALSYCSAFGTLMPPLFDGTLLQKFSTPSGHWILFGIIVCLLGIVVTGWAGMSKDREMSEEKKREVIKEFNFWKGILVATFSGIMSASFAYGLNAAQPIAELSAQHGTTTLWTGPAEALRGAARRLHHQFHLVRAAERQERDRLPVLPPDAPPGITAAWSHARSRNRRTERADGRRDTGHRGQRRRGCTRC